MRQLTNSVSADGEVRRETRNGIEYLVFPSIIAKSGVMEYPEFGRNEYLPAEHLEETVDQWADMPITVNHPPDRGEGRTAKIPESYTSEVIGRTFNPEFVDDERVKVENWVDINRAQSFGGVYEEMLDHLENGQEQVGVSTGYDTVGDEFQPGSFRGNSYSVVQGTPIANHVALVTPDQKPRLGPEDGVGAPRLNHVDMSTHQDDTESTPNNGTASASLTEQARAFGAAFKETFGFGPGGVTTNTIRTNAQSGDAVRWQSDGGGSREPDSYRYGVVVDGLTAEDEPDDSLLVAVYRANSDRSGWENTGDQETIENDNLEVVGNDGKASLPAVSDVVTNTVDEDSEDESEEAAEADDDGEADAEPEDATETEPDADADDSDSESDSPDADEDDEESDIDSENESTDNSTTMTDDDTQQRIEELAEDDDVPFDENVLSEFTDAQLDAIDAPREDDGEGEGDNPNTEDEPPEGEMPEGEPSNPDEARDEDDEEDDDGDNADAEADSQSQVPEEFRNELDELREELESVKQENQDLRQKTDPDVIKATQARQQLAEATDIDASELDALPDDTAINMAANLDDGVGLSDQAPQQARANTIGAGAQSGPNMAGAPGSVTRTNTEDDDDSPKLAGRAAYEARNGGGADSD